MTNQRQGPTRDCDLSRPIEELSGDERLKAGSRYLRGTVSESLCDPVTGSVSASDAKLIKFHGIYMQDDRDLRAERAQQKLEPAYQFMVRVRLPGGALEAKQWLMLDAIAREFGSGSLRLTTRQTFQFHGVIKSALQETIGRLDRVLLDTIAACGDDCRGVMCSVEPKLSALHREVYELARAVSEHMRPRTRAYREIWLGEQLIAGEGVEEEPFYGATYLPRKFKVGFAIPPVNDIDVFTQDLGFIAIASGDSLVGFNVCVGGGMGRTDRAPKTYPRLADVIGFITPGQVLELTRQVAGIQRDFGDRVDRSRARFKYTIDRLGLSWFRAELEERLGASLEPARQARFDTNQDSYGWARGSDGFWYLTLFVENGRVQNDEGSRLMDALRAAAERYEPKFRVTPNQNIVLGMVADSDCAGLEALLLRHGIALSGQSPTRRASMACVAFPTCGLAMAESERYLPTLLTKVEALLLEHELERESISVRMTGCPNGCARPYVAEIGLTGRAPGKYNLYLGGGSWGQRLNVLFAENIGEARILDILGELFADFARQRRTNEPFGDFLVRSGKLPRKASGLPLIT